MVCTNHFTIPKIYTMGLSMYITIAIDINLKWRLQKTNEYSNLENVVRIILKFDSVSRKIKLEKKSCQLCAPTTLGLYTSHLAFWQHVQCQNTQNDTTSPNIVRLIFQARFVRIKQFLKISKNIFLVVTPALNNIR